VRTHQLTTSIINRVLRRRMDAGSTRGAPKIDHTARLQWLERWSGHATLLILGGICVEIAAIFIWAPSGMSDWEKGTLVAANAAIGIGLIVEYFVIQATIVSGRAAHDESEEKVAESNQLARQAQGRTEELRADNLALQKLMLPRRLGSLIRISSPDDPDLPPDAELQFSGIRAFSGIPVVIQVVPDFEAQMLARDMVMVLGAYGWRPQIVAEAATHVPFALISDGIQVTYTRDNKFAAAAQALATGFTNAGLTGPAGWSLPRIFAQGMPVTPDGAAADSPMYPRFDKPVEAVIVLVGMKPIPSPTARAS
jgi:hypothetical protein